MKLKIENESIRIIQNEKVNEKSINIYEIEFEFSEEWDELNKKLIISKNAQTQELEIIDSKVIIPSLEDGSYEFGVVGYIIENDIIVKRKSTNMISKYIKISAAGYEANTEQQEEHASIIDKKIAEIENLIDGSIEDITEAKTNAIAEINQTVESFDTDIASKIQIYNENANAKLAEYNQNSISKIQTFNDNATSKTEIFNQNANTKIEEYNNNTTSKIEAFNQNAVNKTNEFNNLMNEYFGDIANALDSINGEVVV